MANLRDLRIRMRAIRQTLQVTRAMNLISTSKLRKGRRVLEDTEPYFTRIQKSMFDIISCVGRVDSVFFKSYEAKKTVADAPSENEPQKNSSKSASDAKTAIVVMTSDKGLAGGYNANIFRQVNQLCARVKNPVLILIGTIGYRYFVNSQWTILENFTLQSKLPVPEDAQEIAEYIISQYLWGMFNEVHIVYTHMYSSIKLVPRELQLLPLSKEKMQEEFEKNGGKRTVLHFEYWPSKNAVFESLVPKYIKGILYGSLIEAHVSEQSARMSAMSEASKNAEDMLNDLQLHYNRARQAGITQEITEISGGAEASGK